MKLVFPSFLYIISVLKADDRNRGAPNTYDVASKGGKKGKPMLQNFDSYARPIGSKGIKSSLFCSIISINGNIKTIYLT